MNYENGHDQWTITPEDFNKRELCKRCHRLKPLGTCEDGCRMCQSCYHKVHGMGELPSDSMEQENKAIHNKIFALVKEIWGKNKAKTGFCWIAAKFGNSWNTGPEDFLDRIVTCLESKRFQTTCLIHLRVHDAKPK
jgi:hypothetical protein